MKIVKVSPLSAAFYASMILPLAILLQASFLFGAWLLLFDVMGLGKDATSYMKFYISGYVIDLKLPLIFFVLLGPILSSFLSGGLMAFIFNFFSKFGFGIKVIANE